MSYWHFSLDESDNADARPQIEAGEANPELFQWLDDLQQENFQLGGEEQAEPQIVQADQSNGPANPFVPLNQPELGAGREVITEHREDLNTGKRTE